VRPERVNKWPNSITYDDDDDDDDDDSNMKLRETPSSGSEVPPYRRTDGNTDMTKLKVFSQFV
jgi:hypothetical protein